MVQTLNAAWTELNFLLAFGRHCTRFDVQPITSASSKPICAIAIRTKGRLTDILPVRPGSLTLSLAAKQAITRNTATRPNCIAFELTAALARTQRPRTITSAMNARAEVDRFIIGHPRRWSRPR